MPRDFDFDFERGVTIEISGASSSISPDSESDLSLEEISIVRSSGRRRGCFFGGEVVDGGEVGVVDGGDEEALDMRDIFDKGGEGALDMRDIFDKGDEDDGVATDEDDIDTS